MASVVSIGSIGAEVVDVMMTMTAAGVNHLGAEDANAK